MARWAELLRWQARKLTRKPEITYGLQWSTGRNEMGRERRKKTFSPFFLIQGNGIKIQSFEYFPTKFELDSK
jgi:hypothetical protein